jgi:hypothetical protein
MQGIDDPSTFCKADQPTCSRQLNQQVKKQAGDEVHATQEDPDSHAPQRIQGRLKYSLNTLPSLKARRFADMARGTNDISQHWSDIRFADRFRLDFLIIHT